MLLYICGELRTDSYEKDGVKQYRTKIAGSEIKILSNGSSVSSTSSVPTAESTEAARQQSQQYVAEPATATATSNNLVSNTVDEDMPF
jgi:single-stranded DNA-binding protein